MGLSTLVEPSLLLPTPPVLERRVCGHLSLVLNTPAVDFRHRVGLGFSGTASGNSRRYSGLPVCELNL